MKRLRKITSLQTSQHIPLRVIHAPAAVAGNAQQLAKCMSNQGHIVTTLVYEANQFVSENDIIVWPHTGNILWREWRRLQVVFRHVTRHDVYIFNYGSTLSFPATDYNIDSKSRFLLARLHSKWVDLLQYIELLILLVRRALIVVVFQGDDARQGDVLLKSSEDSIAHHVSPNYYTDFGNRRKRKIISRMRRFGVQLVALNPDLLLVLGEGAVFLPYGHIDLDEWLPLPLPDLNHEIVVGHFPSNPEVKGTSFVVEAIRRLQCDGVPVRLDQISGVSRDEVQERMGQCHILVDQLHAGFYGGVAVEAMSLGRPTIAYIRESDLMSLPGEFVRHLPVISASTTQIEDTIRSLCSADIGFWQEISTHSREFVEAWHNPLMVSRTLLGLAKPMKIRCSFGRLNPKTVL